MSNLLESILRVGMTVFIVGPLTAWVARRGARERSEATDSLDCVPSSKNRQIRLSNFDTLMLTASGRAGAVAAGPPAA